MQCDMPSRGERELGERNGSVLGTGSVLVKEAPCRPSVYVLSHASRVGFISVCNPASPGRIRRAKTLLNLIHWPCLAKVWLFTQLEATKARYARLAGIPLFR